MGTIFARVVNARLDPFAPLTTAAANTLPDAYVQEGICSRASGWAASQRNPLSLQLVFSPLTDMTLETYTIRTFYSLFSRFFPVTLEATPNATATNSYLTGDVEAGRVLERFIDSTRQRRREMATPYRLLLANYSPNWDSGRDDALSSMAYTLPQQGLPAGLVADLYNVFFLPAVQATRGERPMPQVQPISSRQQRARAAALPQPVKLFIDWNDYVNWQGKPIVTLSDGDLHYAVVMLVRTRDQLFDSELQDRNQYTTPALVVSRWLARQPAFRALLIEAVRRKMTFDADVFKYLKEYVLASNQIGGLENTLAQPWSRPENREQLSDLASALNLSVIPEPDYADIMGRPMRKIDLS